MANEFGVEVSDYVPVFKSLGLEILSSDGTPTASGPKTGALCVDTTNGALFINTGTVSSATWDNVAAIAASEITLAEGNQLVGNGSGVGTAIDASAGGNILVGNDTTMVVLDLSTDTQIAVGNGTTITSVALSGDATMANTGAVTVASSAAGFSVGTTFTTGSTTTSSGGGAVAITGMIHEITTTGTGDALTLADGAEGQHLNVVYVAEGAGGDTAVLTPTNLGCGTTLTFNAVGDSAMLLFTAGAWQCMGGTAVAA